MNFKHVEGTLRSISSPGGGSTDTRKHRKPAMPKQTSGPMSLVHSHEIMKLRIFTSLNERRKGTFPKKR